MANFSRAHICQCLTRLSIARRDSIVTVSGDRRKTGRDFVDGVLRLAGGLIGLGLRNGDVVVVAALNSDLYLEWILAVSFVGGIVAPLNHRWNFNESRTAMLMVEPVLLVTDQSCASWVLEIQNEPVPSLKWHVSMELASVEVVNEYRSLTTEVLKAGCVKSPLTYSWASDGAVIICFTSGTTGRPKGVTISHSAIVVQSLAKIAIVGYCEDDVYLHTAPLNHIGGLSSAMAMLMVGACHILPPKFEAEVAVQTIKQQHVTALITVPAMMADLISLNRTRENGMPMDSVRKILNGGGSLSSELIKHAARVFPRAKIVSAYGMTEATSSLTYMTLYDPTAVSSSNDLKMFHKANIERVYLSQGICVGKPAPHVELKVDVDGSSHTGKILTCGPHTMLRYWDQEHTKTSSDSDAGDWLDTGDIGSIDEFGNLWLIGRANCRIKSGGENVSPEEVEAVLFQHLGVMSAVVVGIPHSRLGEMVVGCVRLKQNWKWSETDSNRDGVLSSEMLRRHCRTQKLTGFKIPKMFMSWTEPFPVTTTGKVRRDEVRQVVMSRLKNFQSHL